MSTPVINAIDNVNQTSLETVFAAVAEDPTARDDLSQSDRNIDKVSTNAGVIRKLDASEDAILRLLCRREGRDPSDFNTLDDVADDVSLVRDLSVRQATTKIIQSSAKADSALSANDRATREMICFPAGLNATTFTDVADVASDAAAMNTIFTNAQASRSAVGLSLAMQEVAASQTALDEIVASQTALNEVAVSQTAMKELTASQEVMDEIVASQTLMDKIAARRLILDEIAASQTAASTVAASSTAVGAIEDGSTSGSNSVPITNNATIYVAELEGSGGGGGDGSGSGFFGGPGSPGGDTSFHQSVAEGGEGGSRDGGSVSDGEGTVSSPDIPIDIITGGGGSGSGGKEGGGSGGDGAFVKALIVNPERQSLSLTVGNGGSHGGDLGGDGADGSATIFTPNAFL